MLPLLERISGTEENLTPGLDHPRRISDAIGAIARIRPLCAQDPEAAGSLLSVSAGDFHAQYSTVSQGKPDAHLQGSDFYVTLGTETGTRKDGRYTTAYIDIAVFTSGRLRGEEKYILTQNGDLFQLVTNHNRTILVPVPDYEFERRLLLVEQSVQACEIHINARLHTLEAAKAAV